MSQNLSEVFDQNETRLSQKEYSFLQDKLAQDKIDQRLKTDLANPASDNFKLLEKNIKWYLDRKTVGGDWVFTLYQKVLKHAWNTNIPSTKDDIWENIKTEKNEIWRNNWESVLPKNTTNIGKTKTNNENQKPKWTKITTQNNPTNNTNNNQKIKDKEDVYLSKNRSLTDIEYAQIFSGLEKIWQWNLGDCYLISAINVLARNPYFDTLMKTSIKKNWQNYILKIPLGEPWWVEVKINPQELLLAKVKWNIWYKLLEVWFAKYVLKQNHLWALDHTELQKISGGMSGFALQTFLWAKSLEWFSYVAKTDKAVKNKPQQYEKWIWSQATLSDMSEKNQKNIINLLKTYNLKNWQWFITVWTVQWESHDKIYTVGKHTLYKKHAYAVLWSEKDTKWNIKTVQVLNPWNTENKQWWAEMNMTLDEFMQSFATMDVGNLTNNFLNLTTSKNEVTITDVNRNKKKQR